MARRLFPLVLSISLLLTSCALRISLPGAPTPGPEVVDELTIPWPETEEGESARLDLKFGGGEFFISPADDEEVLLSGSVTYNLPDIKPRVEVTGKRVEVIQGEVSFHGAIQWDDVTNIWRLQLGTRPLDLHVQAGAYQAEYDLGGLALTSLIIQDGAADVHLSFSRPNQAEMSLLRYETGASEVRLSNLSNANFKTMIFKSPVRGYCASGWAIQ